MAPVHNNLDPLSSFLRTKTVHDLSFFASSYKPHSSANNHENEKFQKCQLNLNSKGLITTIFIDVSWVLLVIPGALVLVILKKTTETKRSEG